MKLTVKSLVWDDLREIGLHIAKDNPAAANRFFVAAKESFDLLNRHRGLGRPRSFSQPGIRSFAVPGFRKYLIFYLPVRSEVQILAVLHGALGESRKRFGNFGSQQALGALKLAAVQQI